MDNHPIVLEAQPASADVRYLDEQLYQYNVGRTGYDDGEELLAGIRDERGQLLGGAYGWTWGGWLELRTVWITEALRGHGYGRALVEAAEAEARRRGCSRAYLASYSFQAPGLYQKLGYTEFAVVEGFPIAHRQHFFCKTLDAAT
jgi:GNAT superfamily N-acetyltransferase